MYTFPVKIGKHVVQIRLSSMNIISSVIYTDLFNREKIARKGKLSENIFILRQLKRDHFLIFCFERFQW